METPEEFVCRIRDRYEDSFTMDWDDAEKEVVARDAAIRKECAERAIAYCAKYEGFMDGLDDNYLRAAIMAEPPKVAL